jgi:guanylate kinase
MMDSMSAAEQQKEAETGAVAPVSDRLQQDKDTVEEIDNKDYDIFNNNIDKGDNETQRTQAADAFLGKFKLDLKQKKNFQPVLPT